MGNRSTVELLKPSTLRYSVRRARTEDERAQLVEHVGTITPITRARPERHEPRWQVEVVGDRVTLRHDGVALELPLDEARRIAEAILRRG